MARLKQLKNFTESSHASGSTTSGCGYAGTYLPMPAGGAGRTRDDKNVFSWMASTEFN